MFTTKKKPNVIIIVCPCIIWFKALVNPCNLTVSILHVELFFVSFVNRTVYHTAGVASGFTAVFTLKQHLTCDTVRLPVCLFHNKIWNLIRVVSVRACLKFVL